MLALVLTVDINDVEIASDELWGIGVVAVEERSGTTPRSVELWTSLGNDQAAVTAAMSTLTHKWSWRFENVDETISETWRDHAIATWIAEDLVVYPAWAEAPSNLDNDAIAISIEPGATFGMGDHPTTVLSLRALLELVTVGKDVLDVGCGSGVLAIAACLRGARHAVAIDISPAAVPTTIDNARRNGVADRIHVSTTPLHEVSGTFDIVLANILAPALIDLSDDLKRVLASNGALVICGILAERHDHVLEALRPLRVVNRSDHEGWTAITLRE